jgi:integrase
MAGGVYKRVSPRTGKVTWQAKLWRKNKKGVWGWKTGTFATRTLAREALLRWQTEVEPDWSERPLVDYLRFWLADVKRHAVKEITTLESYRWQLETHVVPALGSTRLCDLTAEQIQAWVSEQKDHGRKPRRRKNKDGVFENIADDRPLSSRMVAYSLSLLRACLQLATDTGLLPRNPAAHAQPPKRDAKTGGRWTDEQARAFLKAAAGHRYGCIWMIALATGVRPGELKGLRWADIDFEARTLRVHAQVQEVKGGKVLTGTKRDRERTLRLAPLTVTALRNQLKIVTALPYDNERWQEFDLVFPSAVGTPLTASRMRLVFNALCARAGVPVIRLHDLRHTSASLAIEAGVPLKTVSERLGHMDVRTTLGFYVHSVPETEESAAAVIESLITEHTPSP